MITSTENRATIGRVMVLGLLLAMLLPAAPAGAAAPLGKAFSWGYNEDGQLGNSGTDSDVPVTVRNLSNVKNIDGGNAFTLAATL